MSSGSPVRTADNGRGEEQIREPGSGAMPDAAPRDGDAVLQVVGHLTACQLFHGLPGLPRQGAFNGRVEA